MQPYSTYFGAYSLGKLAGARTFTPLALLAWSAHWGWQNFSGTRFSWLGSKKALAAFTALAVGELIVDKLPGVPSRTSPPQLLARLAAGALAGAALCAAHEVGEGAGAALGGVGAAAGTFAGAQVRARAVSALRVADWPVALIEDAVAVGGSLAVLKNTH